jgi:hypothetical protein
VRRQVPRTGPADRSFRGANGRSRMYPPGCGKQCASKRTKTKNIATHRNSLCIARTSGRAHTFQTRRKGSVGNSRGNARLMDAVRRDHRLSMRLLRIRR